MKPTPFKEQNIIFAKDQPQYIPLPAFIDRNDKRGQVVFCMSLSLKERLKLLFTGKLWCSLLMFRDKNGFVNPLTPSYFTVNKKDLIITEVEI